MKLRLLLGACTVVAMLALPAVAQADPFAGPPICDTAGKALFGTHGSLTVWGDAYVPAGKTLTVRGNLTIAHEACLDAFTLGTVHVRRNIWVEPGAILALGCTPESIGPGEPCNGMSTNDTVGRSIFADHPLTMYLDGNTVGRHVVSVGGGPGLYGDFLNFPIKDNTIGGNLIVRGWRGGWSGAIRNDVGGNLRWSKNMSKVDPDSNEVQTNTVGGNLYCFRNSPAAQVNAADGGLPNVVAGSKFGQCAGL
jgi:hypothetical protein